MPTGIPPYNYDLRGWAFDVFVDFIFNRPPVPPAPRNGVEPWYYGLSLMFDERELIGQYIRLFSNPKFLIDRFSDDQLESGFWAIHGGAFNAAASHLTFEQGIPFEVRESFVRSMYHLYADLFADHPLDSAPYMWWDSFAYDWHAGGRVRERGGEDLLMQEVMWETLQRILALPQEHCQMAALHGLNHLHHPDTTSLINVFLERNPHASDELKEYAVLAAKFQHM
ncbi:hypothetical protein [Piscinibacterium candidicorallinum]|uniref:hypothetical protein n=1 Tax=Piscinibacterium candidicorallinum TaxID=1793872 RepID=UPI003670B13D